MLIDIFLWSIAILVPLWIMSSFLIFFLDLRFWRESNYYGAIVLGGMVIGCAFAVTIGFDDLLRFWGTRDEDGEYVTLGQIIGPFVGFSLGVYIIWITESKREFQRKCAALKEEVRELVRANKDLERKISSDN